MKRKIEFPKRIRHPVSMMSVLLIFTVAICTIGCFLKQDRTIVVYGSITDQNQQPIDSILVMIKGVQGFKYEVLKQGYSDSLGHYELVVELPKKYGSGNLVIPFGSERNSKFDKHYKGFKIHRDDEATNNCCFVYTGEKTKYDFQLIPK